MTRYDDIISLPHHVSDKHPHMTLAKRAAQFSAFDALSGYSEAIDEAARITDGKIELDEYETAAIDRVLRLISEQRAPLICITYFERDKRKNGGKYLTCRTRVKKTDTVKKELLLSNGNAVLFENIVELSLIENDI